MAPDKILLAGIEFYGHLGLTEAEREVGQRYVVDVELSVDLRRAAQSDAIAETVNYAEVYGRVVAIGESRRYRLIEPLADELARVLLEHFPAQAVRVRVKKQPPPIKGIVKYAGVEVYRERQT